MWKCCRERPHRLRLHRSHGMLLHPHSYDLLIVIENTTNTIPFFSEVKHERLYIL